MRRTVRLEHTHYYERSPGLPIPSIRRFNESDTVFAESKMPVIVCYINIFDLQTHAHTHMWCVSNMASRLLQLLSNNTRFSISFSVNLPFVQHAISKHAFQIKWHENLFSSSAIVVISTPCVRRCCAIDSTICRFYLAIAEWKILCQLELVRIFVVCIFMDGKTNDAQHFSPVRVLDSACRGGDVCVCFYFTIAPFGGRCDVWFGLRCLSETCAQSKVSHFDGICHSLEAAVIMCGTYRVIWCRHFWISYANNVWMRESELEFGSYHRWTSTKVNWFSCVLYLSSLMNDHFSAFYSLSFMMQCVGIDHCCVK